MSRRRKVLVYSCLSLIALLVAACATTAIMPKPIREAPTPAGWPTPTPVGEIHVKEYPAARLAVAKTAEDSDGDKALFGRLFSHIKDNDIPMTAPVEMTYVGGPDGQKDPGMERQSMAFYYRDQTVGSAGAAGDVEVVDVPALTVVSIGLKGSYRESDFRKAYAKLLRWLDEHRVEYTATGNVRVLAYNSPFMPFWMKYSEVQVPISKLSKGP